MPKPVEICLEELDGANPEEPFVRCVALPGGEPGLALDPQGRIQWMPKAPGACGLWVTADDRLALLKSEGGESVWVERGSRTLEVPAGQPVLLLDQDLITLAGQRFRLHVHGEAAEVHPPERLSGATLRRMVRAAAAAAALALGGAAAMAAAPGSGNASHQVGAPAPIEVRTRPPAPMPAPVLVNCDITSQKAQRKGPLVIQATCKDAIRPTVGKTGGIVDKKTDEYIKDGSVRVTAVKGAQITCEAPNLTKPVPNTSLRFLVRRY